MTKRQEAINERDALEQLLELMDTPFEHDGETFDNTERRNEVAEMIIDLNKFIIEEN